MTFQYFFFSTYPGYFLQVLPIALAAGAVYGCVRYRGDTQTSTGRKIMGCAFVCYMTGLFCLVAAIDIISDVWYRLIYRMDSGRTLRFFAWDFNLVPDFWAHLNAQTVGNFLMFLPFGILFPLFRENADFGSTVAAGVVCIFVIELLQPVLGRAFDVNDIIMNAAGVIVSAGAFFAAKKLKKQ